MNDDVAIANRIVWTHMVYEFTEFAKMNGYETAYSWTTFGPIKIIMEGKLVKEGHDTDLPGLYRWIEKHRFTRLDHGMN